MTLIPQRPFEKPYCPWTGIDGGPQHPAHAVEVMAADRVYAVTKPLEETATDAETLDLIDKIGVAASRRPGMELYKAEAGVVQPSGYFYQAHYFRCLVCGFVLPAQAMRRG